MIYINVCVVLGGCPEVRASGKFLCEKKHSPPCPEHQWYLVTCDDDLKYQKRQRNLVNGQTWCVDAVSGVKCHGTTSDPGHPEIPCWSGDKCPPTKSGAKVIFQFFL